MERGYWQARQAESRYRLLFQVATDAVLVVDRRHAADRRGQPGRGALFDQRGRAAARPAAASGFEHRSRGARQRAARRRRAASGQSGEIRARLLGTQWQRPASSPRSFRADDAMRLLVRVRALDDRARRRTLNQQPWPGWSTRRATASSSPIRAAAILLANPAFVALVRPAGEAEVQGPPARRLARACPTHRSPTLIAAGAPRRRDRRIVASARSGGAARSARRSRSSAALLTEGDQECIGFTLQPQARRAARAVGAARRRRWHAGARCARRRSSASCRCRAAARRRRAGRAPLHRSSRCSAAGGDADAAAAAARRRPRALDLPGADDRGRVDARPAPDAGAA